MRILALSLCVAAIAFAAEQKPVNQIRVLPVKRTPESETATVKISIPKNGAVMKGNPVWVQTRVEGYPLGASSQFDRADEIAVSDKGQSVHVVVDDQPYFPMNVPALDPSMRRVGIMRRVISSNYQKLARENTFCESFSLGLSERA